MVSRISVIQGVTDSKTLEKATLRRNHRGSLSPQGSMGLLAPFLFSVAVRTEKSDGGKPRPTFERACALATREDHT